MREEGFVRKVLDFYREGFSGMDTGRTLWLVIIVKVFIIFFILKLFFMPDVLKLKAAGGSKADYVSSRLTGAVAEEPLQAGETTSDNKQKTR